MIYTTDVELPLTIEVVSAEAYRSGSEYEPPTPASAELRVCLGTLDVTAAIPGDVLEALEADALERLEEATEP